MPRLCTGSSTSADYPPARKGITLLGRALKSNIEAGYNRSGTRAQESMEPCIIVVALRYVAKKVIYNILRGSQKNRFRFRVKMFKSSRTVVATLCYLFIHSSSSATLPPLISLSQPVLNKSDTSSLPVNINTGRFTEPNSQCLVIDLSSNQTNPNNVLPNAPIITLNHSASNNVLLLAGVSVSNQTNLSDINNAQPL